MALGAHSSCRVWAGVLCLALCLSAGGVPAQVHVQATPEKWRQVIEPAREAHLRGQTSRAEDGYRQALRLAEQFDRDGQYLEQTLADLGGLCFLEGRYGEAADFYRQALPMAEALFAPGDPRIALYRENLKEALAKAGEGPATAQAPAGPLPRLNVADRPPVPVAAPEPVPEPAPVVAVAAPARVRIPPRPAGPAPESPAPPPAFDSAPASAERIVMVPLRGYVPGLPSLPRAEAVAAVEAPEAAPAEAASQQVADAAAAGAAPVVDAATETPPPAPQAGALAVLPEAEPGQPVAPEVAAAAEPDVVTRIVRAIQALLDPPPLRGQLPAAAEPVPDQVLVARLAAGDAEAAGLVAAPAAAMPAPAPAAGLAVSPVPAEAPVRVVPAPPPPPETTGPPPLVVTIPAAARPKQEFKPSELGLDTGAKAEDETPAPPPGLLSPELLAAQPELAPRSRMPPLPRSDPQAASLPIPARPAAPPRHLQDTAKAYERDVEERQRQNGPNSPEMGVGLYNLARLYHRQSRYAQARTMYERALAIQEDYLPADHPDLTATLKSYGLLLRQSGFGEKAQEVLARVKPAE